jgi:hypothetical protein
MTEGQLKTDTKDGRPGLSSLCLINYRTYKSRYVPMVPVQVSVRYRYRYRYRYGIVSHTLRAGEKMPSNFLTLALSLLMRRYRVYRSRYLSAHFSFIMVYLGCLSKRSKTCCANKLPYHIKQHRIKTDGEEKCRDRHSCDRDP